MTWTILHDACEHQDKDQVIKRARSNSEEAVMLDDHGSTPLHIACWSNPPTEIIRGLLDAHPNAVSDKDRHGDTPLHVALTGPCPTTEIVKILLDSCPMVTSIANREGLLPLHQACRYCPDRQDILKILVDAYPFALRTHIKIGDIAPQKGSNKGNAETVMHAVVDGTTRSGMSTEELRFLDRGIQIRDGAYPLHMLLAGPNVDIEMVENFIVEAPDILVLVDKFGRTPLHVALENRKDGPMIDMLLLTKDGRKATRMSTTQKENLPIHVATAAGCSVQVAKALLLIHPNAIHQENCDGQNPFEVAMTSGKCSPDVIRLLEITDAAESE
eukprot:scaffold38427_cov52-Attheya_sp.AAC.4